MFKVFANLVHTYLQSLMNVLDSPWHIVALARRGLLLHVMWSVCQSVCVLDTLVTPCKNGWTNWDDIYGVESDGNGKFWGTCATSLRSIVTVVWVLQKQLNGLNWFEICTQVNWTGRMVWIVVDGWSRYKMIDQDRCEWMNISSGTSSSG